MKRIILISSFISVFILSGLALADNESKKDNWFENEFEIMDQSVKKEYKKLYTEAALKAANTRIEITTSADKLAAAIENNANEVEQNKYVKELTDNIVKAGDDVKSFYLKMAKNTESETDKFLEALSDHSKDNSVIKKNSRLFSVENSKMIEKMLDEVNVPEKERKEFIETSKKDIRAAEIKVNNTYRVYSGFYLAGITSGAEFEKAKMNYTNAIENMIKIASNNYSKEVAKLDKKQLDKIKSERKKMTEKQIKAVNESIKEIQK